MNRQPFEWANSDSQLFMGRGYLDEGQTIEDRAQVMANRFGELSGDQELAGDFYHYYSLGYYSLASPILANYGTTKGLPISCNGSLVEDDMGSILMGTAEAGMMAKHGAGTSSYWDLRPRGAPISAGGTADGPVHYMRLRETNMDTVSQGNVRRGSEAEYMDIKHPDFWEFMDCREEGSPIQNLSLGVCVGDDFMERVRSGDEDARNRWLRVLKKRFESGYPYIFWKDRVNGEAPAWFQDKGQTIWASNLCTEICQPATDLWSFVCCLASINVLHWDEIKETDAVEVLLAFLDTVIEEYIQKTEGVIFMQRARDYAIANRAVGIGVLGWHSLLQSKSIPFGDMQAMRLNNEIFRFIDERSWQASADLAEIHGEPSNLKGYGQRNATRCAIAPTTSSSFILGQVSPSVEPLASNYFIKDLAKGKFTYRNPFLAEVIEGFVAGLVAPEGDRDAEFTRITEEIWLSILTHGGSVQHLDFLSDHEKDVFRTFGEISQGDIINQAAQRQPYIDQSQSINLMIHPDTPLKEVNALMFDAWEKGLKTLYYQRSTNPAQELARSIMTCTACEA